MGLEIQNFLEDNRSDLAKKFRDLPVSDQVRVVKRMEIITRKPISQLLRAKELEQVKGLTDIELYELKFRLRPPVRMLGLLEGEYYIPLHLFVKKSDRIPLKDLRQAASRARSYLGQSNLDQTNL